MANSTNWELKSTSVETRKLHFRAWISVSISVAVSILVKSRRTDAAQPPHVMLGTLSETSTNFEGSTAGAASAASDVFGASGVEPPAGGVVGAEPPPESHPIRAHERLIAISQAVKFFMGQFSTIGLKRTPRTRPFSLVWLQHQTTRSDLVHTDNVDPMSRIVKGNPATMGTSPRQFRPETDQNRLTHLKNA